MLQTGYLTFKEHIIENIYRIDYPNKEVEHAFSKMLLEGHLHKQQGRMVVTILDIEKALKKNDIEKVIEIIKNMFKTLPSPFFKEGVEITDAQGNIKTIRKSVGESFYHAVIYLVFKILGIYMQVELPTQEGRIDAVVETETHIYVFEFSRGIPTEKKNRKAEAAINQIHAKKYADHFALSKKEIYLIGVAFNLQKRGISDHIVEFFKPVAS